MDIILYLSVFWCVLFMYCTGVDTSTMLATVCPMDCLCPLITLAAVKELAMVHVQWLYTVAWTVCVWLICICRLTDM